MAAAGEEIVVTNLPGQSGTASYTDTNADALGRFYRVGVGN